MIKRLFVFAFFLSTKNKMHSPVKSNKWNNFFIFLFVCGLTKLNQTQPDQTPNQTKFTQTTWIKSKQLMTKPNQPKANQLVQD